MCEINVKEQLLESLKSNILKKKGYEQKYHELQQEVQRLEKEKSKMGKTRAGKSRDLKRIEILEGKLAELRKQLSKKQEALRIIAREAERARKLDKSIQALKAAKVRMIRNQKRMEQRNKSWRQTKLAELPSSSTIRGAEQNEGGKAAE